jgi:hypothetical protein
MLIRWLLSRFFGETGKKAADILDIVEEVVIHIDPTLGDDGKRKAAKRKIKFMAMSKKGIVTTPAAENLAVEVAVARLK